MSADRKGVTRRQFLRTTAASAAAATAAAVGAGLAVPRTLTWPGVGTLLAQAQKPPTLVQGVEPETLDPHFGESGIISNVLGNVMEALIAYDRKMRPVPFLAESYEVLNDKVTWRFKLRQNIKFQNGKSLNAEAVKFTIDRTMNADLRRQGLNDPFPARSGVTQVKVVNASTVDVVLARPNIILPVFMSFLYMMEPEYYSSKPPRETSVAPMGTGPWKVDEWIKGDRLALSAFDGYWRGAPQIKRVVFRPVPEKSQRMNMLITGEADIAIALSPDDLPIVERVSKLRVSIAPGSRRMHIGIPTDSPKYKDRRVRYALSHAIDWDTLSKGLLGRLRPERRATVLVAGESWVSPRIKSLEFNRQRARSLLTEAGFPMSERIRIYTPVGRYLKDKETAEAVAGQFREIGLQAEAAPLDWTIYTDKMRSPGGMDDLYLLGLGSRFNGPEDLSIVTTGQIWDQTKWITHTQNGPKFNAMYKELIETIDEKKQREMAFQMEQLFVEETPWINLDPARRDQGEPAPRLGRLGRRRSTEPVAAGRTRRRFAPV
jgi:peptide/nickel transport system substrate-binding protein